MKQESNHQKTTGWMKNGPWHRCLSAVCQDIDEHKAACRTADYKWNEASRDRSLEEISHIVPLLARGNGSPGILRTINIQQFKRKIKDYFQKSSNKRPAGCTFDTFWDKGSDNFDKDYFAQVLGNARRWHKFDTTQTLPRSVHNPPGDGSDDEDAFEGSFSGDEETIDNASTSSAEKAASHPPTLPVILQLDLNRQHATQDASFRAHSKHEGNVSPQEEPDEHPFKKRKVDFSQQDIFDQETSNNLLDVVAENTFELDRGQIKSAMDEIAQLVQATVSGFLSDIKLSVGQASVYGLYPDSDLGLLFRTSFGDDVPSACEDLTSRDKLLAFHVLRSLISAFICNEIFGDHINWQRQLCHKVTLAERKGKHKRTFRADGAWRALADKCKDMTEPFFKLLDLFGGSDPDHARQQARRVVAQQLGDAMDNGQIRAFRDYAQKVSQHATATLLPHLERLIELANMLRHKPVKTAPALADFSDRMERVVDDCLRLKINLSRSSHAHTFFWPAANEKIDLKCMNCPHQQDCRQPSVVAYTLLPGIMVSTDGADQIVVRPADVMARAADSPTLAATASPLSQR